MCEGVQNEPSPDDTKSTETSCFVKWEVHVLYRDDLSCTPLRSPLQLHSIEIGIYQYIK